MSGRQVQMDDAVFDRLVGGALRLEAERVAATQPAAEVALARLAAGVDVGHRGRVLGPRATALAWLALLLLAGVALVVVGSQLLRQDRPNPIVLGGYGPPAPCGLVPVADDMLLEAFRDEAVLMIDRSGLVTILSGDPDDAPPEGEGRYRTRVESRFVAGVLLPAGAALVTERLVALGLEPGCYTVRTDAGDAALYANTPYGSLGVRFSVGSGAGAVAPRAGAAQTARLEELLGAVFALESWLPPDAFMPLEPEDLDSWIVHTTLRSTGYDRAEVVDGRYDAVRMPGGGRVEDFGSPMPASTREGVVIIGGMVDVRARDQRCGLIGRSEAFALADSLDPVVLNVGDGPDLYTQDMATAVTIRLHPAVGANSSCEGFGASIEAYVAPSAEPSAPIVGDLAGTDPCSFVPADERGRVQADRWSGSTSPFGIAAGSCVIEWHHSMTEGGAERILWLYPATVSEADARSLSTWIFGVAKERALDGAPVWLNDCLAGQLEWHACRWAVTGYVDGRYVLLEVSDPEATIDGTLASLGRIIAALRQR